MLEEKLFKSYSSLINQKPNLGLKSLELLCRPVITSAMQFVTNMPRAKQEQDGTVSVLTCMVNAEPRHSKILCQSELYVPVL